MAIRTRRRSTLKQAVANNAPPTPANASAVWWADDIAQADGSQVASWTDRVNGISVTQATANARPLYATAGVNGRPSVNFDGSNDFLGLGSSLSSASAGSVVAVVQISNPLLGQSVWSNSCSSENYRYILGTSRYNTGGEVETQQANGGSDDIVRGSVSVPAMTLAVLEWSSSGTAYIHRLNNSVSTMMVGAGTNSGDWFGDVSLTNRWSIGALVRLGGTIGFFGGKIAYLGVFDSPLSAQDRYGLYKWTEEYYGITGMSGLSDYEQAVLADSPAAFWPMQETSGNLIDVTGGNRNLSVGGGTPDYYQSGIGNFKSINFDGSTEWLYANDSDIFSSPSFSLEAWVNLDSLSANAFLFEKRGGSGTDTLEYHFYAYPPSGLWFQMGNLSASNYVSLGGSSALFPNTTGTWFHCVATFNDTDGHANVYCNGILVAGTTTTNGSRAGNSSGSLRIGRRSINAYGPMDGRVSMSAFYPHALTQPQIQAHYEAMTT